MKKRPKPQKRTRAKLVRAVHRNRVQPARVFRVKPEDCRPFVVEVRLARTRQRMLDEMRRIENSKGDDLDPRTCGLVRHWYSTATGRPCYRPGQIVARMYLNRRDLQDRPSEVVSHECVHAGMAWSRLQRANLKVMPGEEILAHAVGRMVAQVNRICYAERVWPS